ncbi:helix-turn-helix domain-containing protein [Streptomyces sp. NPDC002067]
MPPRQDPAATVAARFGRLVADAARRAGYDIDTERGGGRAALARDAGMTASSVGRMLTGTTLPHPRFYEALAAAIRVPLRELLVEAEIISPQALTKQEAPRVPSAPVTPEEAATELGIEDPLDRELFLGMVARLKTRRPGGLATQGTGQTEPGEETAADG